ncbi:hypothetical protein LL252_12815 [Alcanivorax marinus]|uniref:Undecaprenyl-phosphate alpha-N-acetylglucosaminyl 1-phosphate transferase n=1 Tax=Alloalcanivorax marinus TaxID=1177169 RepID=A0A9Q3YP59_9GAMM|nr:hypothetical protein [Alloalcanivorax marinus]MCC4309451.1 hypothetical protein [Alloalcanivorax marinus]
MEVGVLGSFLVPLSSMLAAFGFLPLAHRLGFVDHPNGRKQHAAPVPLAGGGVVFVGLMVAGLATGLWNGEGWGWFLTAAVILTTVGTLDDIYDLSARWRFLIQGVTVALACAVSGVYINSLGLLLGDSVLLLGGFFGLVFTLVCALACINAYNMIDGIDGQAGSVTLITLAGVAVLSTVSGHQGTGLFAGLSCLALLVYLMFNLEVPWLRGRKMFLGDGGSNLLGFLVLWLVVLGSQRDGSFAPIVAVWLVGVPILDMLAVFMRRTLSGRSPFSADRTHIHHLLLDHGFSARQALLVVVAMHAAMVGFGVVGTLAGWSELTLTVGTFVAGGLYFSLSFLLGTGRLTALVAASRTER